MAIVTFFNVPGISTWLIRVWTRRRGQSLASVPSHCGIAFKTATGYVHYQAIIPRINVQFVKDLSELDCLERTLTVNLPDEYAANVYAHSVVGEPYDFWALAADVLGRFLPRQLQIQDVATNTYDCSRYVPAVIVAGGGSFATERLPPTPNSVEKALLDAQSTDCDHCCDHCCAREEHHVS